MKKPNGTKVEYKQLLKAGLTESQLESYSNCDPLDIYAMHDGTYSVRGMVDADGMTIQDIAEMLDSVNDQE